ncbi:hypothetical protein TgHK011_004129 [Trichoderma gracile]|nr:hypothetical protein TgHK011_004129 [Trichoderma gracile]
MKLLNIASLLSLVATAQAHMEVSWPPVFRSKYNPRVPGNLINYDMTSPLNADGSNYPCKGYQVDVGRPEGAPGVTWRAGGTYNLTVAGSATHSGGSCQASLSYDRGRTWVAIYSWIGGCPLTPTWEFTLPNDTPPGEALFAWTWFNRVGNREMYMNCGAVTIRPSGRAARSPADSIYNRPAQFVANVNNGCATLEGADVLFPNPGPDTEFDSDRTAAPVGRCGASSRRARPGRA